MQWDIGLEIGQTGVRLCTRERGETLVSPAWGASRKGETIALGDEALSMRGRTLNDAFIILDEAQNTTPEQMKMFLTRMGVGSKVVVTGDVTQVDLPDKVRSGLVDALQVLRDVDGIAQVRLTEKDVVRHRLVQQIVKAYEKAAAGTLR